MLEDDGHAASGIRHSETAALEPRPCSGVQRLVFAAAMSSASCGPTVGAGSATDSGTQGSGDAGTLGGTGSSSDSGMSGGSSSGVSAADTSSGAEVGCIDNIANPPFCFRKFAIETKPQKGLFGRMGPAAEPRFFFPRSEDQPYLIGWDGVALVIEPQSFPSTNDAWVLLTISPTDAQRDDLLTIGDARDDFEGLGLTLFGSGPSGLEPGLVTTVLNTEVEGTFAAADVDGDGVDELVAHVDDDLLDGQLPRLRILEWDGVHFVPGGMIAHNPENCGNDLSTRAIDVDGDPFEDVIISNDCYNEFDDPVLHLVRGAPDVAQMQVSTIPLDSTSYYLEVADFDGDGWDDAAMWHAPALSVIAGKGDGSFGPQIVVWTDDIPLAVDGDSDWTWDFGDIDGDGATEILAGRTAILDATGSPTFVEYLPIGAIDTIAVFVAAGDISGDGIADLAIDTYPNTQVLISGPPAR